MSGIGGAAPGELLARIRLGEDSFLELKEVRFAGGRVRGPSQEQLADELAAFANAHGGMLLLGVGDDSREVLGIPVAQLDEVEAHVRQACEDSIRPPLAPLIERLTLPDATGDGPLPESLLIDAGRLATRALSGVTAGERAGSLEREARALKSRCGGGTAPLTRAERLGAMHLVPLLLALAPHIARWS